nr:hypothetical protein [Candidatus Sigynarchaeota archaeon]
MTWKKQILACAIAGLVISVSMQSSFASILPSQEAPAPWNITTKWSFIWQITESSQVWMKDTRLRFIVHAVRPVYANLTIKTWKLDGNLSRYLNLGPEADWTDMRTNATYAEFDTVSEKYSYTTNAFLDNMLFLPMVLPNAIYFFQAAYAGICNDSSWNISINETTLVFDARNKTATGQRIFVDFNTNGAIENMTRTYANGTTEFQMVLESMADPAWDISRFFNVMTMLGIGAIIVVVISCLFRKYKIKAKDVVRESPEAEDEDKARDEIPHDEEPTLEK